jgi:hypothetical protein
MRFRIFKEKTEDTAKAPETKKPGGVAEAFVNEVSGAGMFQSIIKSKDPYRDLKNKPKSP